MEASPGRRNPSKRKRIVVLTGAGISAESGLKTFRDPDGLWEGHRPESVATPEAFARDPTLVQRFYNERRRLLAQAEPNAAHHALVDLEDRFHVVVVTQNVDDLHERAGSTNVLHLHGELLYGRSADDPKVRVYLGHRAIEPGETAPDGRPLRPDVVWFGESVPKIFDAVAAVSRADLLIVVGTSLAVYPAAGLVAEARSARRRFLVDPEIPDAIERSGWDCRPEPAGTGVPRLVRELLGD
jgi:NAD-dependent deacetylase